MVLKRSPQKKNKNTKFNQYQYHAVQERILRDMGYKNINVIPLDQADLLEFKWVKTLQELSGKRDLFAYSKFVKAVIFFLKKAKLLSDIQYISLAIQGV